MNGMFSPAGVVSVEANLCKKLSWRQSPYCTHCFEGMAPDVTQEVRRDRLSEDARPDIIPDIDS